MASKLPIEILEKIFRNFLLVESTPYNNPSNETNDYSTGDLYSCLLVNWQWCEAVIPLLWSDPFRQSTSITKQHDKILDTYFQFLNYHERKLIVQNNHYHRNHYHNKTSNTFFKKFLNGGIPKMNMYTPNTMYDYPFFAKHIDVGAMICVAKAWCARNRLPYRESAIVTVILKLMRRNGATIERLSGPFRFTTRPEFLALFQQNPELEMWISSVKSCHMVWNDRNMDRDAQKQYTIATLSNHLECLDLDMKGMQNFTQKRKLATIGATMRQFHSLNQFIGRSCGGDLNAIVRNLKLSVSTLLDIEFVDTNFKDSAPLNSLLMFDNLEVLTFRNCDFLTLRVMQPLMTVPYCHLKQLRQVNFIYCHDVSEHVRDWAEEVN
ncbi:14325_t:CDS:2, partial [Ambispora leptoticha]